MWGDPFGFASEDEMHPGSEDVYGERQLLSCIDRIREYVREEPRKYAPDVLREVAAAEAYIDNGIAQFEAYLSKHAEFSRFLEGSTG